jgi:hypothetical protein
MHRHSRRKQLDWTRGFLLNLEVVVYFGRSIITSTIFGDGLDILIVDRTHRFIIFTKEIVQGATHKA